MRIHFMSAEAFYSTISKVQLMSADGNRDWKHVEKGFQAERACVVVCRVMEVLPWLCHHKAHSNMVHIPIWCKF